MNLMNANWGWISFFFHFCYYVVVVQRDWYNYVAGQMNQYKEITDLPTWLSVWSRKLEPYCFLISLSERYWTTVAETDSHLGWVEKEGSFNGVDQCPLQFQSIFKCFWTCNIICLSVNEHEITFSLTSYYLVKNKEVCSTNDLIIDATMSEAEIDNRYSNSN